MKYRNFMTSSSSCCIFCIIARSMHQQPCACLPACLCICAFIYFLSLQNFKTMKFKGIFIQSSPMVCLLVFFFVFFFLLKFSAINKLPHRFLQALSCAHRSKCSIFFFFAFHIQLQFSAVRYKCKPKHLLNETKKKNKIKQELKHNMKKIVCLHDKKKHTRTQKQNKWTNEEKKTLKKYKNKRRGNSSM